MDLKPYIKETLDQFNGLYQRGMSDQVPKDHSSSLSNVSFGNSGEVATRDGLSPSFAFSHPVRRLFISAINATLTPLTLDDTGNLYIGANPVPIFTAAGMIDFVALNMFNRTYILPILASGGAFMQVWNGTYIRDSLGFAPLSFMAVANAGIPGNIVAGVHGFAVSYLTDTGFITKPTIVAVPLTATGVNEVDVTAIPIGPTGTVGRWILTTKANLNEFFFVHLVNDNTTNAVIFDFLDTSLVISADYLFDERQFIIAGSTGGIDKFHDRLVVFGGEGNLARVSKIGDPEAFDDVTGYIQFPDEKDGNVIAATFQLRDSLYFTKSVGIFAVIETGDDPSEWRVIPIDGGAGAVVYGVSTITSSQPHLPSGDVVLLADLSGLLIFDGVVRRPELTWKIENLWKLMVTFANFTRVTVCVDPFKAEIYVHPADSSFILVGNYSLGLTAESIKWSVWSWTHINLNVKAIALASFTDNYETSYSLRISFTTINTLYKVKSGQTTDAGAAIRCFYQTTFLSPSSGTVNCFRALVFRARRKSGGANLALDLSLSREDTQAFVAVPSLSLPSAPGREYLRQINFMGEKMLVLIASNDVDGFVLERMDSYAKKLFDARPG